MRKLVRRPSPAMIVAIFALSLAVGGSAVAAKKIKLGKNVVKTKNIKNGAVTEDKIASGAVSAGKLAGSAKAEWAETNFTGTGVARQSGGVTFAPDGTGQYVIDFGVNISNRAINVTPLLAMGAVTAHYGRCADEVSVGCPAPYANSANAISVATFAASTNTAATTGFTATATP